MQDLTNAERADIALVVATFPTPNVRRAVALAESGAITWRQLHTLFRSAIMAALVEVSA